jgi:hypothetical protein
MTNSPVHHCLHGAGPRVGPRMGPRMGPRTEVRTEASCVPVPRFRACRPATGHSPPAASGSLPSCPRILHTCALLPTATPPTALRLQRAAELELQVSIRTRREDGRARRTAIAQAAEAEQFSFPAYSPYHHASNHLPEIRHTITWKHSIADPGVKVHTTDRARHSRQR